MINPAIEEGLTSLGLSVGGTGAQYSKKKQFGFNPNCFFYCKKGELINNISLYKEV